MGIIRSISVLSIILCLFVSCSEDPPEIELLAQFNTDKLSVVEGQSIQFTDASTGNPTGWIWNFEGGDPSSSTDQNPTVFYEEPGVYTVSLTVSDDSRINTIIEKRLINVTCTGIYCGPDFESFSKTTEITYGADPEGHKMILYEPDNDTRTDRPVVVIMGGGASLMGTNLELLDPLATNLVRHGVLVALIEYRVIDSDNGTEVLINAQQDCRTAVRYLKSEKNNLGINPDHIFIGGNGSGAFAALFHAYIDESDLSQQVLNVVNSFGGLEGEGQGHSEYNSDVIGVISLAGGIFNSLDPITSNDVPIYAIHGTQDSEVPIGFENNTYGSRPITEKVAAVGLKSVLFSIPGGGHTAPRTSSDDYILELMYFIRDLVQ